MLKQSKSIQIQRIKINDNKKTRFIPRFLLSGV